MSQKPSTAVDLQGRDFGGLHVVERADRRPGNTHVFWRCTCACGVPCEVSGNHLLRGTATSCGCNRITDSPEYTAWKHMVQRCRNDACDAWKHYGGRGIQVVDEWVGPGGFERFLTHVGPRPSAHHSIDRKENEGHYEPGNVRWVLPPVQARNTRRNVWITHDGVTLCIADWSARTGLPVIAIRGRLRRGWSPAAAVSVPSGAWRYEGKGVHRATA